MKERLPLWFQALALILLSGVFMATVGWVWHQDRNQSHGRSGAIEVAAYDTIYRAMPVPIIFLGTRLLWRFIREDGKNRGAAIICVLALAFVLPPLLAFFFAPGIQRVRESSMASASLLPTAAWNSVGLMR